jgi:hypothetical protein
LETYYLKQLQSIAAWRGSLVDTVIEKYIIPKLNESEIPEINGTLTYLDQLWTSQLEFAQAKRYRNPKLAKTRYEDRYCALYDLEYNSGLNETALQAAKKDCVQSLTNLLDSELLQSSLLNAAYLIPQRNLSFQFSNSIRILCRPDLIVLFKDRPPLIIDWKVHSSGKKDARLQLGIYAIVFSRCSRHADFKENLLTKMKSSSDIHLKEYQLLLNQQREYEFSPEDVLKIEEFINSSANEIIMKFPNKAETKMLNYNFFLPTTTSNLCKTCNFKKICLNAPKIRQTTLFELNQNKNLKLK